MMIQVRNDADQTQSFSWDLHAPESHAQHGPASGTSI
jgi:hypothetical protein